MPQFRIPAFGIFFLAFFSPLLLLGQGCPACSNPNLPSSGKLMEDVDSIPKGYLSVSLNIMSAFGLQGGHLHDQGLDENNNIISVPVHRHEVSLNLYRALFSLNYTFKPNWSTWIRIPYAIKEQIATIHDVDPVTIEEKEAIIKNGKIHHRTATYRGFHDLEFLVSHRKSGGFVTSKKRWDIAFGFSLPVGETEIDPLKAKLEGKEHLHIQFGSGTINPLAEIHYVNTIGKKIILSGFLMGKFPFYENKKTYRGPMTVTGGTNFIYKISDKIIVRNQISAYYQGLAHWDGQADPNTGIIVLNDLLGVALLFPNAPVINLGIRLPILQKILFTDGDAFNQTATYLLDINGVIND